MAVTVATATAVVGVVSSLNGCVQAVENLMKSVDTVQGTHTLSTLLKDIIRSTCTIISEPARITYLNISSIQDAAGQALLSCQAAQQWEEKYSNYSRLRRFIKSDIYEKRYQTHILCIKTYTEIFMQLCFAHSIRTPSIHSAGSDCSESGRLDLVETMSPYIGS